jgi:hypothetical protein
MLTNNKSVSTVNTAATAVAVSSTATAQANTATAVSVSQLFATDDVQNVATSVLAGLEGTRKFWENGALKASNQALYAVLADCLQFCGDLNDGKKNKARNKALELFHAERNYPYSADSKLATKVVRAVFGKIHRSRINTYALVVNAAKAANVEPANMANWIDEQGGVQEIKVAKGENTVPRAEKIAKGQSTFEDSSELATVQDPRLQAKVDNEKAGASCVLLAEQNDDGTFTVKALSYKDGLVKTALTALYADEKAAALKQAKEQKAA